MTPPAFRAALDGVTSMTDRQSGRTTRQMQDAPNGAVFVWPVFTSIGYAVALARYLGRNDLHITTAHRLNGEAALMSCLVLDHACDWFFQQSEWDAITRFQAARARWHRDGAA